MTKVSTFDGGLIKRLDPSLLQLNQAETLNNVEPESGVLTSVKAATSLNPEVVTAFPDNLFNFKDEWLSGTGKDWIEYDDILYSTDGIDPKKYKDRTEYNLGIEAPAPNSINSNLRLSAIDIDIQAFIAHISSNITIGNRGYYPYSGEIDSIGFHHLSPIPAETYKFKFVAIDLLNNNLAEIDRTITVPETSLITASGQLIDIDFKLDDFFSQYTRYSVGYWSFLHMPLDLLPKFEIYLEILPGEYKLLYESTLYAIQEDEFSSDVDLSIPYIERYTRPDTVGSSNPIFYTLYGINCRSGLRIYQFNYNRKRYYKLYSSIHTITENIYKYDIINYGIVYWNFYSQYGNELYSNIDKIYTQYSPGSRVLQYVITNYNNDLDIESIPSVQIDNEYVENNLIFNLTNLPESADPQVSHIRIYRLGGNLTDFTLVAELDNGTTEWLDIVNDQQVDYILESQNYYPPEDNMHSLTEYNATFFGLVGNELRFSIISKPDYWPPEYSFKLPEEATGLLGLRTGLLVFTKHQTYLLSGTGPENYYLGLVSNTQGCLNHKSCKIVKNYPVWISYDGICTIQSGYVQVISKSFLGKQTLDVKETAVYNEQYYILLNDNTILVFDTRYNARFYTLDLGAVTSIYSNENKLYLVINNKIHEAFTGDNLELEYHSPIFTEGLHTVHKMYNHIYIRYDGNFEVEIYIDKVLVSTVRIQGNETEDVNPPAEQQRGYNCQLKIKGTGTIYAVEFDPLPRQKQHDR